MDALNTLMPVFFMLILGYISKRKGWISEEQKNGANALVFNILFPIMIFNLMAGAKFDASKIGIILYVLIVFIVEFAIGKIVTPKLTPKYSHFASYLITVVEGGNVSLPLYLSIVGISSNTVIYDIAGVTMCFIIFPFIVSKEASTTSDKGEMLKKIFSNTFVIAVLLGLLLNITGIYEKLLLSSFGKMISSTLSQAMQPIIPTILSTLVILGFFIFFPTQMSDPTYMIAPIIYFMSPTGFGLIPIIEPLYKSKEDESFTSGFVSMFMIVTLIVYTAVVLFV
ncbi:AEC family transporter [Helcococcus kunzii]|uniref:AEC family transporter n=1 Tax=Helcococcus kunzii TaxID=40091 RepID=UPI0021A705F8|nr:AEC family transporter [Helcococcus kunzii]MCT1796416.1 AEC family transporter [Helcococcus kunzii]MCT1989253.1 AEC family transporter [Helcococcus kunzii]